MSVNLLTKIISITIALLLIFITIFIGWAWKEMDKPYQINESLWKKANPEAIFLHCLPAHRGYEVTESIIDGPQSKILSEAHNRMKTARGLFNFLIN